MIRVMKRSWPLLAIISFISVIALPVKATESRCGWLRNPTPANWYLKDGDSNRMRIIAIQGGEVLPLSTCREDPNLPKE